MTIECVGTTTTLLATSDLFHVFEASPVTTVPPVTPVTPSYTSSTSPSCPATGLKTQINTFFTYKGKIETVQTLIEGFDSSMGSMSCLNCPEGML